MVKKPHVYLALPIMDELGNIHNVLRDLRNQTVRDFTLVVCINQHERYWNDPVYNEICLSNARTIQIISNEVGLDIVIIDKSSRGKGWPDKKGGVGWARKTIMDHIITVAKDTDYIISIDADTNYPNRYIEKIQDFFIANPDIFGLAVPYYHKLEGKITDRLILRYELYMRYYLLNMIRIDNMYSFTAVGSAMAFPVWALKKVGGLTPVAAGEDFYFLQKLVKSGPIGIWVDTIAYPSSRFSARVAFGTGPALIKGNKGDWSSYPFYNANCYDDVKTTYDAFDDLYTKNIPCPFDDFLKYQFNETSIWDALRNNYRDKNNFVRACRNKIDGLRILQFLRYSNNNDFSGDKNLFVYLEHFLNISDYRFYTNNHIHDLNNIPLEELSEIRDLLFKEEISQRKARFLNYSNYYA